MTYTGCRGPFSNLPLRASAMHSVTSARSREEPPPLAAALASGAVIVTPNNRLARHLVARYDRAQRAAGRTVWTAPTVMPWNAWLETLWATIAERVATRPEGSYTARLLGGGVDAVTRKVTEEVTEVLLAAKDDATAEGAAKDRTATADALAGETADLLYHALVLLAERGLPPAAVIGALRSRHSPDRS